MKSAGYSFIIAVAFMMLLTGFRVIRPSQMRHFGRNSSPISVMTSASPAHGLEFADVGDFHGVVIDGSFSAVIQQGDQCALSLQVPYDVRPYVRHQVKSGVLHLYLTSNPLSDTGNENMHATITLPDLTSVVVNGSGDVTILNSNSSGLGVTINGSSQVNATGSAHDLNVSIKGSGRFDGRGLTSSEANASVSGSGEINLNASQKVTSVVAGSGSIHYIGHPKTVTQSVSGSGEVDQDDSSHRQ
jgi:hypothetical protein